MIQEKLDQAKKDYRQKLRQRLGELAAQLSRLRQVLDVEGLAVAQLLAHRICGSAGSFGFAASGEAVRIIDQTLLSLNEGLLVPSPAVWDRLEALIARALEASEE